MGYLSGATWMFRLGGITLISGVCAYLSWFLVSTEDTFTDRNSEHYIASPEMVAVAAVAIGFIVSYTFMTVFDSIADTILFCWAVDRDRQRNGHSSKDHTPEALSRLLDDVERDSGGVKRRLLR